MTPVSFSKIPAYWAEKLPQKTAVAIGDETISWAELDATTNRLARAYASLGVKQDDLVTIGLPNSIEFVQACFACWKLGATPQPVSAKLPKIERDAIIDLAKPSLVVGTTDVDRSLKSIPVGFDGHEVFLDDPLEEKISTYAKAVTSGGSTGRPKLIVEPAPSVWDMEITFLNIPHQASVLVPGPLYHNGPFLWSFVSLFQGNSLVLVQKFDAEETLNLIDGHSIEHMYIVPTMMQRIWKLDDEVKFKYDLRSLKSLCHTAAPCPAWLKEAFIEWLGPSVIWELYGGTEGIGSTFISGEEWLKKRGSVGRATETCEIKIFGEDGSELPPSEIGDIYMRPVAERGETYKYIGAEATTREGGWESLGDMGYLDEDGYLFLADRRTDMILCGGANIYPAEVEAAIDAFPGVRSSAAIGLPHDDLGNTVHAIVDTSGSSITQEQLLEFLKERLVLYKLPRSFEFVSEPLRDDAGKVRRKALREARLKDGVSGG